MQVRILQALTRGQVGGTELMVLRLVTHLDRTRFACEVSLLDGHGPMSRRFAEVGVLTHDLRGRARYVGAWWRLVRLLRSGRFHILHLYGLRMSLLGRVAARVVRPRPVVIHGIRGLHVTEGEEVSNLWTKIAIAIERAGAPLVDAYIANSHGAMTFLCSRGVPKEKFIIIPNGIALSPDDGQSSRPERDIPEIICVANFRPRKRHADLIESLALLGGRGVKIRCLLVGEGPTRPATEALAHAHGLGDTVEFLGRRAPEEVATLLRASDIFVLPSLWEGMPVAVMEAMVAGLPVVGTDVPGIRDLVVDGVTGSLAPAKDPPALADRLQRVLGDPALRARMGEAGRARILTEFSLERMVQRYEAAYAQLAEMTLPTVTAPSARR